MKVLSNYTHAKYCSDESDLCAGIDEIRDKIKELIRKDKKIPSYFYARLQKLETKLKKMISKEIIDSADRIMFAVTCYSHILENGKECNFIQFSEELCKHYDIHENATNKAVHDELMKYPDLIITRSPIKTNIKIGQRTASSVMMLICLQNHKDLKYINSDCLRTGIIQILSEL